MAADQELPDDQLPAGHTPVWIQPPYGATKVQMLEKVETMAGQYQDVMVLYHRRQHSSDERAASDWCEKKGWKYQGISEIYGSEAQCVVLLDCDLRPELITRGINMLIIVKRYYSNNFPSLCCFLSLKIF